MTPIDEASERWEPVQVDGEYLSAITGDGGYADAEVLALPGGGYRLYVGEMASHSIVSLVSDDGLSWTREQGVRLASGAFPDAVALPDGRVRLYYQGPGVIQSAISADGGLTFLEEPGTRVGRGWHGDLDPDNVGAPTTVHLADGRFRMYYRAGDEDDAYINGLKSVTLSAVSDDGLAFTPEEGVRIAPADWVSTQAPSNARYLDGPEAVLTDDGELKLYFWGFQVCTGVCLSVSEDGLAFDLVEQVFHNDNTPFQVNAGDPTILPVADGPWIMYFGNGPAGDHGIWIGQRVSPTP